MKLEIKEIPENYVMLFKKTAGKVIQIREDGKTKYLGAYRGKKLVGFVGYLLMGNQIRFKADYVLPSERGQGVYMELSKKRLEVCKDLAKADPSIKTLTCFSSKMSRKVFTDLGFIVKRQVRERTAFMEKEI